MVFPTRFDMERRLVYLDRMTRESYSASVFLDHRIITAGDEGFVIPEDDFLRQANALGHPGPAGPHFVFHMAFCGSTLLCRCLDTPGRCLPYKEPFILHQLSFFERRHRQNPDLLTRGRDLTAASVRLLARGFVKSEVALVKPSDSCGNLARQLLGRANGAAGLFLYRQLRPFLVSVLKTKERRAYVRGMAERAQTDLVGHDPLHDADARKLPDARLAAYVWLSLVFTFSDVLANPDFEARSLDADVLFGYPRETLAATGELFHLPLSDDEITAILESGILRQDAKAPTQQFDADRRGTTTDRVRRELASEISDAVAWLSEVACDLGIPEVLPRPLPT